MIALLIVCLLVFSNTNSCSSSLVSDFHALISLKQGFEVGLSLTSWNASNPMSICSSWIGIQCSRGGGGRVVSVDLTDMKLGGGVNSLVISSLDSLKKLSLAGNNLSGTIEIANLTSLEWLNISNNQLSGGLDWISYSTLGSLQVFDAYNNNFTAFLPTFGVASLEKLKYLDLGGNYFYGRIPGSYGGASFPELEYLSLAGNDLHGKIPGELGNLTNLKEIYLGYFNNFQGGIPIELGKLKNLVVMDLSSCQLEGSIPGELGRLESLETLFLHINLLSGSIPKQLGNLTRLVNLDLSNNALTGEIPSEFNNLKQLKLLNLFMNKLHGSIPDLVADELLNLETLGLWMNNFTGIIPQNLGRDGKKLQVLDLSSNKLTGTIPPYLCSSNQLKILILLNNFLFGPIPQGLGTCSSLVRVRLGENYLNGTIPNGFIYLPELNLLEFQNNYLSGTLSENNNAAANYSKSSKLGQLNLSNNMLSGSLPFSLSNFSSLEILLLGGNQFSGPIPPSVGKLGQLLKLDISRNSLSGEIPREIGNCFHLTYLDMSQNNFSGQIPSDISKIRILNYLNLSRNHLIDTVPKSIGTIKSLTIADFSFNQLSGKLPDSGQFALFNASSFAGNPQLCGSLLNNPCTSGNSSNEVITTTSSTRSGGNFKLIFALGLLICSLVFSVAAIIKAKSLKKPNHSWKMTSFQKLDFAMSDILECMKDGNVIGRGGAGIVYHGKMPNGGIEIAVKKLRGGSKTCHNDHGFRAEIQTLGNIRHRNIVRLLAFCSNKETNLLVYEYMTNGSLGEALHGKISILGWYLRYKIATEAAKGLCYLHHDCSPLIVHRDVKSNNILLNSNFEAHVADFGLAKFLVDDCMSAIAGSYGYIAPEYAYTLRVDEKSDVYSFGVVLLELITGRRPVGNFGEGVDIVQWSKQATNGRKENVNCIIDPRLTIVPQDEAMHVFFIAMLCIQENNVQRPTMREVVQMLSDFPHHSTDYQSSSSSIIYQEFKNVKKERECPKVSKDLLV